MFERRTANGNRKPRLEVRGKLGPKTLSISDIYLFSSLSFSAYHVFKSRMCNLTFEFILRLYSFFFSLLATVKGLGSRANISSRVHGRNAWRTPHNVFAGGYPLVSFSQPFIYNFSIKIATLQYTWAWLLERWLSLNRSSLQNTVEPLLQDTVMRTQKVCL